MGRIVTRRAGVRAGASVAVALALLLACAPAAADPVARWRPYVEEASARFGIPAAWIERVMRAESGGRTRIGGRPILSRAGAMGLMQLMPGTWADMRAAHGLGEDPHDPRDNILAGAAYLRAMFDRFGYPAMFAAYNAGPARLQRHLATGRALPAETRAYLRQMAHGAVAANGAPEVSPPALFVVRRSTPAGAGAAPGTGGDPATPSTANPDRSMLFVPLGER